MTRISPNLSLRLAVLFVVVAALSSIAVGKDNKETKTVPDAATVVAHISLPGAAANQMFLQQTGGKQYLYVDQGANQGYTIVDVSHPTQPRMVKHVDQGNLEVVGNRLALSESPEGAPKAEGDSKTIARSTKPSETVKMLDMSDPANPRTIQSFSGVTSVLPDRGRNLLYIANNEGLWVVRQNRRAPQIPPCTSSDAMAANPDCR
jgi:hypothetical protein